MKQVLYNTEARKLIKQGVDILANAVKVTLGPKGRNVIIDKGVGFPIITKDGVTVAKAIHHDDPLINTGVQLIKAVAMKTAELAGDGTTTATVLAQAIMTAGMEAVTNGANPMELKAGIDLAVEAVVKNIKEQSTSVDNNPNMILQVAMISTNNDKVLGPMIAETMLSIGKDGDLTVENSSNHETKVVMEKGLTFDEGLVSPFFVNNLAKQRAELEDCYILIYDKKISIMADIMPILEQVILTNRPLLIMAEEVEGQALAALIENQRSGNMRFAVTRLPERAELRHNILDDIASLTGATVIYEGAQASLKTAKLNSLGEANKVISGEQKTTIIGGRGNPTVIGNRTEQLKLAIEASHDEGDKEIFKSRLAKLTNGTAVMYIGGPTELEINERKDRADDAIRATQCAMKEGIVPGGGIAYLRAIPCLAKLAAENDEQRTGIDIIANALKSPITQICDNAANPGSDAKTVIVKVALSPKKHGYNARTDEFEDMIKTGIIDPTMVARVALENAASIASMLLTTECLIMNTPNK